MKIIKLLLFPLLVTSLISCNNNTPYTPLYQINWFDGDNNLLKTDYLTYGETPSYDGEYPNKTSTPTSCYVFKGWQEEIHSVSSNQDYHAAFESLNFSDIDIPILRLNGDFSNISSSHKINISAIYESNTTNFDVDAKIKWQGNYTLNYPKKNYSIQFFKKDTDYESKFKVKFKNSWSKESKYCLKANYCDFTQSKNVCIGKSWGNVVKSRTNSTELKTLPNGGAQDGFPIMVLQNNYYQGLYVLNIPKDKWLFDMDDDDTPGDAIVFGNGDPASRFIEPVNEDFSNGIEIEYCSTEDTTGTAWVRTSWNNLVNFVINNDGELFKQGIGNYLDIEAAIDCYIFILFLDSQDNSANNMIYITYDKGSSWIPCLYDFDLAFEEALPDFNDETNWGYNLLYKRIQDNYQTEIATRYQNLRDNNILSIADIDKTFVEFYISLKGMYYYYEDLRWDYVTPFTPDKKHQGFSYISNHIKENLVYCDNKFNYVDSNNYGYKVVFNGDTSICNFYFLNDFTRKAEYHNIHYSRNSTSGSLDSSGSGCIYFYTSVPVTCSIESGSCDGIEDLGDNHYCLKNITSPININIYKAN